MHADDIMEVVKIIGALAAVLGPILGGAFYLNARLARLEATDEAQEFKIAIIWSFLMRGAIDEALATNLVTRNSPLLLTEQARALYVKLAPDLRRFYREEGKKLEPYALQMKIWEIFGKRIWEEVCVPLGIKDGACLVAAVEVAKESDEQDQAHRADSDSPGRRETELNSSRLAKSS